MAATDKTRVQKPSTIKENEQGQLIAKKGISREVIAELSKVKGEPEWMREKRLKSYEIFERKPIPTWGVDLSDLDLSELVLYSPPEAGRYDSWDDVPKEQKDTFEALGIPQAEREHLAGVVGVWRQEPFYEGLKEEYAKQGIVFMAMDRAVVEHEELVREHFMNKCVAIQTDQSYVLLRVRPPGRRLAVRGRERDRRRLLQLRPIVLRGRAHLCSCRRLRSLP